VVGFNFPLQKVLEYRRQLLGVEQSRLATIKQELLKLESKREQLLQSIKVAEMVFAEKSRCGIEVTKYKLHMDYVHSIMRSLDVVDAGISEVKIRRDRQLEAVVRANKDLRMLEKLREKDFLEYNEALAKREERMIEEFVNNLSVGG
jgi:flagellar FliJ protein